MVNVSLAAVRQQQLYDTAFQPFSFAPLQILTKKVVFSLLKIYFGPISIFSFNNPYVTHFLLWCFSQLNASVFT